MKAESEFEASDVQEIKAGKIFKVLSSVGTQYYRVDISGDMPSCQCPVFMKEELPCKHVFAVLQKSYVSWDDLPLHFRTHPLLTLDKEVTALGNCSISPDLSMVSKGITEELSTPLGNVISPGDIESILELEVPENVLDADGLPPDMQETNENVEVKYTDQFKIHRLTNKIREMCKKISAASRCASDVPACETLYKTLITGYEQFYNELSRISRDGNDVGGIPKLSQSDLRYKTLEQLSNPTFKGKKIEMMKRRVPRVSQKKKKTFSNQSCQDELDALVAEAAAFSSAPEVPSNLWAGGLPDADLLRAACKYIYY